MKPITNLSDDQVHDIVRRSYQYVASYNVIHKWAFSEERPVEAHGFNKLFVQTTPLDHNLRSIARPNADLVGGVFFFDVRADAVIVELPVIDSKYVSLEVAGYDHYCKVILSTRHKDFTKPVRVLFYSARTQGYHGDKIPGVDRVVELTSDLCFVGLRVMPHLAEPTRNERILGQLKSIRILTLAESRGQPVRPVSDTPFPAPGETDAAVFGTNLLELMQFVFNHTTFDPKDELDQAVLEAYKPLGIVPGGVYDPATAVRIDHAQFQQMSEKVVAEESKLRSVKLLFRPKGEIDLTTLVFQSITGQFGLPIEEAGYRSVWTVDGQPMNALHDYVIRMKKEELPPAMAFWSVTLYDEKNGFLLPNRWKKYCVGHNTGMQLNAAGGIEIYVAAEKSPGVPAVNWLPTNRVDQQLHVILRLYVPDLPKYLAWSPPKAERLSIP